MMALLLQVLGFAWLLAAAVWVVLLVRWMRVQNRRGGRLGKYLKCSHPEWN